MFLEFVLIRIYSFITAPPLGFWVVAISGMGFGFGAALGYFFEKYNVNIFSILFTLSIFGIFFIVVNNPIPLQPLSSELDQFKYILLHSHILALPFLFGSFIISQTFKITQPNKAFFLNCLGSTIGTFLAFILIPLLGAENSLFLISFLLPLLVSFITEKKVLMVGIFTIMIIFIFLTAGRLDIAEEISKIHSGDIDKRIFFFLNEGWRIVYKEWDMLMRIDVIEKDGSRFVIYEGSYELPLISEGDSDQLLPCLFRNYSNTLVVGSGTGNDLAILKKTSVKEIYAVDINGAVIELVMSMPINPYLNITTEKMDARKFIKKTDKKFELITFPFVDSPAVVTNINYENYLTTIEGFEDFLSHLSENGTLCLIHNERVFQSYLPALLAALQKVGLNQDESIFILVEKNQYCFEEPPFPCQDRIYLIVNKNGFKSNEIESIKNIITRNGKEIDFLRLSDLDKYPQFLDYKRSDFLQITDDRPYIFRTSYSVTDYERYIIFYSIIISSLIVIVFLLLTKKYLLTLSSALVGFGYMMLETAIIQKSLILFPTPPITIGVVLLSFLSFNGIGSLLSSKFKNRKQLIVIFIFIPLYIYIFYWIIHTLKDISFFHKNDYLMCITFLLFLSPLGILLGIPFPHILGKVNGKTRPAFYAVDAAFGTLGVAVGLIISIFYGFHMSFIVSTFAYAAALVLLLL